jgi:hypothetical protein
MILSGSFASFSFPSFFRSSPSSSSSFTPFWIGIPPPILRGELFLGEDLGVLSAAAARRCASCSRASRISCASALIRQAISCVPLPWCCESSVRR